MEIKKHQVLTPDVSFTRQRPLRTRGGINALIPISIPPGKGRLGTFVLFHKLCGSMQGRLCYKTMKIKKHQVFHLMLATWQRPTLPQSLPCSTIGPVALNHRVRYGNGCIHYGIITRYRKKFCSFKIAHKVVKQFSL
jgi:hypothetical protein